MPTYISLINWTEQGVREFGGTTQRAEETAEIARNLGGEIVDIYWTLGSYDVVAVFRFPDDETATACMLAISSGGHIRTSTMRAFEQPEMQGIIGRTG